MVKIPKEYKELTFIQSTGTQWIDTGVKAPDNTDIEVRFSLTSMDDGASNNAAIFGGRNATTSKTCTLFYLASTTPHYFRFDRQGQIRMATPSVMRHQSGDIYKFSYHNNRSTVLINETTDETYTYTIAPLQTFTDHNISLFGVNTSGTTGTLMKGRIYGWKYWENGELLQDFIPCIRKIDQVAGMYDLVSKQFFTNSGTGSFIAGDVVVGDRPRLLFMSNNGIRGYKFFDYIESTGTQYIDTGLLSGIGMYDVVNDKLYTNAGTGSFIAGDVIPSPVDPTPKFRLLFTGKSLVPDEYERVEYLESTGTQFILTGYTPTINTDFEVKFGSTSPNTGCWVMGSPTWVGVHYKGTSVGVTNSSTAPYQQYTSYNHDGTPITLKLQGDTVYANGNQLGTIQRRAGTLDFALFGYRDTNQGASIRYTGKIYSAKIGENGLLVRNLYPVRRKSDNVLGMYDIVTKQLFTNAGTGNFTAGQTINATNMKSRLLYIPR